MPSLRSHWEQTFPGSPSFTESNITSQAGRVFIVTGGNSGVGFELINILYAKNGTVYMASRSREKADTAIKTIQTQNPESQGKLHFLHLDLNDLSSVRASALEFAQRETRLDVLWNNAGISAVPVGSKTEQGLEQHIGVNCVGPLLFTQLLLPQLRTAASQSLSASVRVVWTSSYLVDTMAPPGGLSIASLKDPAPKDPVLLYASSKAGNWMLAAEFAERCGNKDGILSLTQNPGSLTTNIWQNAPFIRILVRPILYSAKLGAFTEAWAGLSDEVTMEDAGRYVVPWGKWHVSPRPDILESIKSKAAGGTGLAAEFWEWCWEKIELYVQ